MTERPILNPLDKLHEWAANYGYSLVPTERIKRLSLREIVDDRIPPEIAEEYVHRMAYEKIARAIVDKLVEYHKLYVTFKKNPMEDYMFHIEYAYEIDVIVPANAPAPHAPPP